MIIWRCWLAVYGRYGQTLQFKAHGGQMGKDYWLEMFLTKLEIGYDNYHMIRIVPFFMSKDWLFTDGS